MAETALVTRYRNEYIAVFEDKQSRLRYTTVTEADVQGNAAVFMTAGSGSASAVTRGANGLITARADSLTQTTATLAEWHDLDRKTRFNIYAGQANQRRIMQETSVGTLNRKIDSDIIATLDTFTNDTGTSLPADLKMIVHAQAVLGDNFVDTSDEDNMFAIVSPSFMGYLSMVKEYGSADYVDVKPLTAGPPKKFRRFMGVNWIQHPRLTGSVGAGGAGTTEQCFMYHRFAVGHAFDKDRLNISVGYNDEQDYYYARASAFFGSALLQNAGGVMMNHDASAFAAS